MTRQSFVISIVPFPYILRDLHLGVCPYVAFIKRIMILPRKSVSAAEVEKFQSVLSATARRNISVRQMRLALKSQWSHRGYGDGGLHMGDFRRNYQPVVSYKGFPGCSHSFLSISSQWKLRGTCMSTIEGPLCFAVPYDENSRRGHGAQFSQGSELVRAWKRDVPLCARDKDAASWIYE